MQLRPLTYMNIQEKINLGLAIIAIVVALGSLLYTIYNDYKIRKLSFDNNGLQNRPLLKFDEKLNKIHYTVQSKNTISAEDLYKGKMSKIAVTLTVDPELNVTNNGNSVANILCKVVTDKYSGLPEIRKILFSENGMESFSIKLTDDYYKTIDILPGKSKSVRLPYTINDVNFVLNEFTIHYLIVYANEIGNVFDSYFWVRFKMDPIQARFSSDGNTFSIQLDKEELHGAVKVIDTHFSTRMYSRNESRKIVKLTRSYRDKLQNNRLSENK